MTNFFSTLKLYLWFNMLMLISGAIFLLCAMGKLPMMPAIETLYLSAGVFFIAFGERTNHYEENLSYPIGPSDQFIRNQKILIRRTTLVGVVIELIGLVVIFLGLYRIFL